MKKFILSIFFINILFTSFSENRMERLFAIKFISFNRSYEIYFTYASCGYYKYQRKIAGKNVFLTYEARDFYDQSLFDENFTFISNFLPVNIWTYESGELVLFKKQFSPVIEKNRILKKYMYGFGRN